MKVEKKKIKKEKPPPPKSIGKFSSFQMI